MSLYESDKIPFTEIVSIYVPEGMELIFILLKRVPLFKCSAGIARTDCPSVLRTLKEISPSATISN
jgi:hypothetical protein